MPPRPQNLPAILISCSLALGGAIGCTAYPGVVDLDPFTPGVQSTPPQAQPVNQEAYFSYWNGDAAPGPVSITINLSDQAAYLYKGGQLVGRSRVATGKSGFDTPTGSFTILEKKARKRSNLFGRMYDADGDVVTYDADSRRDAVPGGGKYVGASMPNWMRLTNRGIGMHSGPIPNPGRPASHGCIRLPPHMAETIYANVSLGTPVRIVH